ncbi:hypothetical protein HHK36_024231 [Tetracentron sinense]|uniref:Uncharacterized protein n=1 Tax=Tetracentron sinense TaxID=13715 RepID=A0A834YJW1_TETSI|nr:hypothetical protein HHK36_024231 [Tetracentron sinense]
MAESSSQGSMPSHRSEAISNIKEYNGGQLQPPTEQSITTSSSRDVITETYAGPTNKGKQVATPIEKSTHSSSLSHSITMSPPARRCQPIDSLNPYQRKWTIMARVIRKWNVKHVSGPRGVKRYLKLVLLDEERDIDVTMFDEVIDKFCSTLENGKVYYISNGVIDDADFRYRTVPYQYQMRITLATKIVEVEEGSAHIKQNMYRFADLQKLQHYINATYLIDVIGAVIDVKELQPIRTKKGERTCKREVLLANKESQVKLTLWGQLATIDGERLAQGLQSEQILLATGLRVQDYKGLYLCTTDLTLFELDPSNEQASYLRLCPTLSFSSLSRSQPNGEGSTSTISPATFFSLCSIFFGDANTTTLQPTHRQPTIAPCWQQPSPSSSFAGAIHFQTGHPPRSSSPSLDLDLFLLNPLSGELRSPLDLARVFISSEPAARLSIFSENQKLSSASPCPTPIVFSDQFEYGFLLSRSGAATPSSSPLTTTARRSISSQQLFKAPNKLDKKMEQGLEPLKSQTSMRQFSLVDIGMCCHPFHLICLTSECVVTQFISPRLLDIGMCCHAFISTCLTSECVVIQFGLVDIGMCCHPFHLICLTSECVVTQFISPRLLDIGMCCHAFISTCLTSECVVIQFGLVDIGMCCHPFHLICLTSECVVTQFISPRLLDIGMCCRAFISTCLTSECVVIQFGLVDIGMCCHPFHLICLTSECVVTQFSLLDIGMCCLAFISSV